MIELISVEWTMLYAGILGVIFTLLSINVTRVRAKTKIMIGDGGNAEMQRTIRVQGNFAEYVPMTLILIGLLEITGGAAWWIHVLGISLVVGRLAHAVGLFQSTQPGPIRAAGVTINWVVIAAASVNAIGKVLGT